MTDGRATAHSEREREFTIGKNYKRTAVDTLIDGVQYKMHADGKGQIIR